MADSVPFSAAEAWGERVLRPLLDMPFTPRTLTNINFPAMLPQDIKGTKSRAAGLP